MGFSILKTIIFLILFIPIFSNSEDLELNTDIILDNLDKRLLDYLIDDTLENDSVTIHTDTAKHRKKITKCWNKTVYDGAGIPKIRLVCY